MRMGLTWRGLLGSFAAVFVLVVASSFAYGVYLLTQAGPAALGAAAGEDAAPEIDVAGVALRAREHLMEGEVEQAILSYRRVLQVSPSSVDALFGLAEGERLAGREDVAAREYERVLRVEPRHARALLGAARIYAGTRETWADAADRYRRYLDLVPTDASARLGLARVLAWSGRAQEAVPLYDDPAVRALFGPADRRDHAVALLEAGRAGEAEPLLAALAAEAPGDLDLQRARAGVFASRQEWAQALPMYREILRARPDDAQANLAYGQGLLAVRDFGAAVAPLSRAASRMPENASARLALARALRAVGDLAGADREYERVTSLTSPSPEIAREYADLLMQRRKYGAAAAWYRRALAGGLEDERLLLGLGGALDAGGRPAEAATYLEAAYSRRPTARLAVDLARLHRRLGNNERALRFVAEAERLKEAAR